MRNTLLLILLLISLQSFSQRHIKYNIYDTLYYNIGFFDNYEKPFSDWLRIAIFEDGTLYFEKINKQTKFDNPNRVNGKWTELNGKYVAVFVKDSSKINIDNYIIEYSFKNKNELILSPTILNNVSSFKRFDFGETPKFQTKNTILTDTIYNGQSFNFVEYDSKGKISSFGNFINGYAEGNWIIFFSNDYSFGKYKQGYKDGIWSNSQKTYKKFYRNKKLIKSTSF